MFTVAESPTHQSNQTEISFLKNWEALADLEQENERLVTGWGIALTTAAAGAYLVNPIVAAGGLSSGTWFQWRGQKVVRLLQTLKLLLETFESKGIEIYPRIPVEGMNPIDLFIRFPKKTHLFISIRSKGDTEVVYNEATEALRIKKKNGTTSEWKPNPLVELADQGRWLGKNRWMFGLSTKDAQKTPTAKVLVLWNPTKAEQHRDELYSEIGALRTLAIRRKGTAFIIQQEEILEFVGAWLNRYEK